MDKDIFYLCHYTIPEIRDKLNFSVSSKSYTEYILSALSKAGVKTYLVSSCVSTNGKFKGFVYKQSNMEEHIYFSSRHNSSRIINAITNRIFQFRQTLFLLKKIKPDTVLYVYHSLAYSWMLPILKKLRKFKLILNVCEIYADVYKGNKNNTNRFKSMLKKEYKMFSYADAYVFSNDLLNSYVNKHNRPSAVAYGMYNFHPVNKDRLFQNDEKIHVVYAGTLSPEKGGASAAVNCVAELDNRYHVHILGLDIEGWGDKIKKEIKLATQKSGCSASYEGCLEGVEYTRFLQSCQIGLCTQDLNAEFNDTSFPAKVLDYMSNGLRVVACNIKPLAQSKLHDLLYFYDEQTPQSIADAIKRVDLNSVYRPDERLEELDNDFVRDIRDIIYS